MRIISAADLAGIFSSPDLVETLRSGFRREVVTPVRHHHEITISGEPAALLLLMPAWDDCSAAERAQKGYSGVKVVSVYPGNAARSKRSVAGTYFLMDGTTGEPLAVVKRSGAHVKADCRSIGACRLLPGA